jgi:hypothetical protein
MEEDLQLGLCIIKVLCLIVIAMSLHRMAYPPEYFVGEQMGKASLPHFAERTDFGTSHFIGDGQNDKPVFWNLGDVESTNAALQAARSTNEEGFTSNDIKGLSSLESLAGRGL